MAKKEYNVLSEDFLFELYFACMRYDYVCSLVCTHMRNEYLPGKDFQTLNEYLQKYYKRHKTAPSLNVVSQIVSDRRDMAILLRDIKDNAEGVASDVILEQFENYLRQVRFQTTYKEIGELYARQEREKAMKLLQDFAKWQNDFSLRPDSFVDVADTFESRLRQNRDKHNADSKLKSITRFYIDALDEMNAGRDLRTQLTCFLAPTGVGKSHAARWIGKCASQMDGLNVLHFQLEGSESEVTDAYSASLVACDSFRYSTGTIKDRDITRMLEEIKAMSGTLKVKSFPKFANQVSTLDIKNGISEYRKIYGMAPDVVIIDSIDLLTDSSGRKWSENGERHKRVAVANDLKDLAGDENVWMVGTYQATIENREWLNDEKNVLTEYNCAEAKGLSRPMTHLITLNQSSNEVRENTMRLYVAKSRFFKRGDPFRIATDYEHEQFYDRARTLNITKAV